ncbi:MAG: C10 family peptidase [Prevotella sp.]|nr:C10 family peptidase [Prevotella sp.]MBP5508497.1 C10 family peptidase [Prevotella sp.]
MKRSFLLTIIFLCAVSAFAGPVTKEQATEKASAFFKAKGTGNINTISLAYQGKPVSTGMAAPVKDAYYYVFNNDNGGFVIVGGDDYADEVLGYSETGTFETDNIPENLRSLLDCYAAEIEWARVNKASLPEMSKVKAAAASKTRHAVAPLVTASWGQKDPYNMQCVTTSGYRAVAGCTALAMAQIMYYHRWPTAKTTAIPSYTANSKTVKALDPTVFNWSIIKDTYSRYDTSDTESRKEVGKLVDYCGRALMTNYGTSISIANIQKITSALSNYFGYENYAKIKERKYFTNEEWNDMLLNELENGRPLVYASDKYGSGSSHAFVIDGFDGNDMYHVNWGWELKADGYFKLSALNLIWASSQSTNYPGSYTLSQMAVIGISPKKLDNNNCGMYVMDMNLTDKTSYRLDNVTCALSTNSKYGFYGASLKYQYRKFGPKSSYDVGLGLFKNGVLVDSIFIKNWAYPNEYYGFTTVSLAYLGDQIGDGNYTIKGIDREDANHPWYASDQSDVMYISVVVKNGVATMKTIPASGSANLKVTKVEQVFDVSDNNYGVAGAGSNYRHLVATIKNTGNKVCNTPISLKISNKQKTEETPYIDPGETIKADFYFTAAAGDYDLKLLNDNVIIYEDTAFPIKNNDVLPELEVVSADVMNLKDGIVYGSDVECRLVLKNPTKYAYDHYLNIDMKVDEVSTKYFYYNKQHVAVAPGETVTVPITLKMALGDRFMVTINDHNKVYLTTGYMEVKPGVILWDGSGNRTVMVPASTITVPASAAAVSFEEIDNISKVTIKPNNNPNALYFFKGNQTVPTSLSKKNVVKEAVSSSITWVGGYDYYVPKAFTTTKISYSFTPVQAYNGNGGWQTIMLPYTVSSVTSGGVKKVWSKKSDSDGQFLLKEFSGDTSSGVSFANVDSWTPCTPYILAVPANMVNKKLVFSAANAWVSSTAMPFTEGDNFKFIASTEEKTVPNSYVLDTTGAGFVKLASGKVKAGSAYFLALNKTAAATKSLSIGGSTIVIQGDANGDNEVTVSDAITVVQAIQSGELDQVGMVDMNNDGRITVTDVMCIINVVVNQLQNNQE